MFTGIVQAVGCIRAIDIRNKKGRLTLASPRKFCGYEIGESIAVNGVCLTVTDFKKDTFAVDLSTETLSRTSFSQSSVGEKVNLEQSLTSNQKMGGHFVMGHVDCVGSVVDIQRKSGEVLFVFEHPPNLASYFIEKGSVALDGISLTVFDCFKESFKVSIIPFTLDHTNFCERKIGDKVNIECDMIGKYVHKVCETILKAPQKKERVTMNFLKEHGFC